MLNSSVSIAQRLQEAANETEDLYQRDVYISYALLLRMLSYQKSLSGFDLTSAQDSKFNGMSNVTFILEGIIWNDESIIARFVGNLSLLAVSVGVQFLIRS